MCDTKRKIGQIFCSLERLPLSKTLCFQQLPGPKELILLLPQKMSKNLVDSYKLFPEVYHARFYQENRPKTFVTVKTSIFLNVCPYRSIRSQKNDLIFCTMLVKVPLFPYGLFSVVFHAKNYEKKQFKFFFTWKIAFFQKFVFSSTSWVHKNALISSRVIVRIASEPLQIINVGLSHSIMREEKRPKPFATGR